MSYLLIKHILYNFMTANNFSLKFDKYSLIILLLKNPSYTYNFRLLNSGSVKINQRRIDILTFLPKTGFEDIFLTSYDAQKAY